MWSESEYTVTFTEPEVNLLLTLLEIQADTGRDVELCQSLWAKIDAQYITGQRRDGKVM